MYRKILLSLVLSIFMSFISCTSLNLGVGFFGFVPNTDPVFISNAGVGSDYGSLTGVIYRGDQKTGQIIAGVKPLKEGVACSNSILYLVSFGDSSIEAAAKEAGITKVALMDHRTRALLGGFVWHQYCLVLYGE
jgi:hypothetical protein